MSAIPTPVSRRALTTEPSVIDRRELVRASTTLNGIDYVDVGDSGTELTVHFLNAVALAGTLGPSPVTISGGDVVVTVAVLPIDETRAWTTDSEGRPVLGLGVATPGDASTYTLSIASPKLDPFFAHTSVRFGTGSPSDGHAAPAPATAPPPVRIDYLAKDFGSFRQALLDFSALRYPGWVERSEADLGVVLLEALAVLADELSYYQDRVLAEAALGTATQRLSLVRHARLVDYEPAPATAAQTLLALQLAAPSTGAAHQSWTLDTPLQFRALTADGTTVAFEMEDPATGLTTGPASPPPPWATVDTRWNRGALVPYVWDDGGRVLAAGATIVDVLGSGFNLYAGQQLLLDTPGPSSADPPVREVVTVASTAPIADTLRGEAALTRVTLAAPTSADHDLAATELAGNLVPVVAGERRHESFAIPMPGDPAAEVVVRAAAPTAAGDVLPEYRYTLAGGPLAWTADPSAREYSDDPARPEIVLRSRGPADPPDSGTPWQFARWLLDAGPGERTFTLTAERYAPVLSAGPQRWLDLDGEDGTTIRFGDGTFAARPTPGTVLDVLYRVGGGASGNVPADTIRSVAPGQAQGALIAACTNPFAAAGGRDAETPADVRTAAPQHFAAELLRVVREEDYRSAAEALPWVRQAGAAFRWTGSWMTVLTSVDPITGEQPTAAELEALTTRLDARRLAGYATYVRGPRYMSIDLEVTVVGLATAFASDVATSVLTVLQPGPGGFFDHARWGFGQALEPSSLLTAIQAAPGVVGVAELRYRPRGLPQGWLPLRETLAVAADQILRLENDPSRPEAGSLSVIVVGAK